MGWRCHLVGTLPRVHPHVSPQVGHLHKLAVTVGAAVGLLSCTKHVNIVMMGCLVSLTCVEPHVSLQMVIPGESFMTFFAFEGFLSCVGSLVVLQHVFVPE